MSQSTAEALIGFVLVVTVIAGSLVLTALVSSAKCHNQWEASGMKSDWAMFTGCRVQRKDGTWVPASVIRDMQP